MTPLGFVQWWTMPQRLFFTRTSSISLITLDSLPVSGLSPSWKVTTTTGFLTPSLCSWKKTWTSVTVNCFFNSSQVGRRSTLLNSLCVPVSTWWGLTLPAPPSGIPSFFPSIQCFTSSSTSLRGFKTIPGGRSFMLVK